MPRASRIPNRSRPRATSPILGRAIQDRFPKYYRYFKPACSTTPAAAIRNHNRLLGRIEGVDGIKTGFTGASGFNLLTNVKTDRPPYRRRRARRPLGRVPRPDHGVADRQTNLPRAYAGVRTAPATAGRRRRHRRASSSPTRRLAAAAAARRRATAADRRRCRTRRRPASPSTSTRCGPSSPPRPAQAPPTTPSSPPMRWQNGAQPLPLNAQAFAALPAAGPRAPNPLVPAARRARRPRRPDRATAPAGQDLRREGRSARRPKREAIRAAPRPAG